MKKLIFLCIASAIVLLTVIVLNVSPIIHVIGTDWYDDSCQYFADIYKYNKDKSYTDLYLSSQDAKDKYLDYLKEGKAVCESQKAMTGLEYASLNINVFCGFTCAILGLLLYLNVNNFGKITGLIGLGSGAVAFVLTLVYIIESGIIFTQHVDGKKYDSFGSEYTSAKVRIDSDGAFLEWDNSKNSYFCIFYKKDNPDSLYRRYSDYGNKYLNYNSDIKFATDKKNYKYINNGVSCLFSADPKLNLHPLITGATNFYEACKLLDEGKVQYSKTPYYSSATQKEGDCDKIFYIDSNRENDYEFQNKYDKYVTSLVLGCFIILLDIGLAIFGFLLFKEGNGTSGPVSIK